jgi:hypothetical protein
MLVKIEEIFKKRGEYKGVDSFFLLDLVFCFSSLRLCNKGGGA